MSENLSSKQNFQQREKLLFIQPFPCYELGTSSFQCPKRENCRPETLWKISFRRFPPSFEKVINKRVQRNPGRRCDTSASNLCFSHLASLPPSLSKSFKTNPKHPESLNKGENKGGIRSDKSEKFSLFPPGFRVFLGVSGAILLFHRKFVCTLARPNGLNTFLSCKRNLFCTQKELFELEQELGED